ncbi:aldose epimerase, partial [Neisseria sp. P0020.S003]
PVSTSPGFHPYFTAAGTQFDFNGAPYDVDYISHTEFVSSNQDAHGAFDCLKLDICTHNLPVYALWSDRNGQYTGAEPTAEGNAFLSPARGGQFVSGHSKKRYAMKIRLMA